MWSDPAVIAALAPMTMIMVVLGAFLGGLAAGGAGFAFGIVGAALWLHVISPVHATLLVAAGGLLIQIGTIWPLRRSLEPRRLWPFLIPGLIGVPVGVWLLVRTDAQALRIWLGAFIAVYGLYALVTPRLPRITGGGRPADMLVGFAGGVLGGIGGYSGVLPAIWTQLRGWPKDTARSIYQSFIVMAHVATLLLVGVVALDRAGLVLFGVALPALLAGAWVGWTIYGRLDEDRFRRAFAGLLLISGILLVSDVLF
jgi:uncharacterized membrane protein YfcA